ncbi:threonine ammonia-lyase, biosynthetic [Gilvimarinus agarilyticus]|uniref:threonine ammonia-lyase, biosynthetic n=1 Tax=unclassified Gilvimarinus TaxID=2642066 RepID=UPI001C097F6A|nr:MULTISPECIES: threonine ammonia-lyase, biosynthetic [unclassified Gilvimarinus]MBU2885783.1 threonine ammonia-lyase, biosynthetic [Gilvimarinus agarilyticus]MDO6570637.1 threonine ammonia-lyase, biosynthetic [Gilvimarinus sp. 2_MG-2023]MDO6748076.1 threonine ammonia-lyase, biosynthetic [Gilvimarinus sp. 1_MG-2023]
MADSYIKRILNARIYDLAIETPLESVRLISQRTDNNVLLKREDLQPVFSFKIRGAYNKLLQLSEQERACGVIAASAGNHAQGLALGAQHLGVKAVIVMPRTTPAIKVDAVRARGAKVILHGDNFDEAATHTQKLIAEKGYTYIHPFDDPDVIAGQGTVAMEILRQYPKHIDAIFVAVGGGGLCAGVAAYVKYVRPDVKVFAVESQESACLAAAMEKSRRVKLPQVGIFAEGVAVAQIGKETFKVIKNNIDGVITVNTDEICAGIKDIFEDTRSIAEPAGAVSLAGLKKYVAENNISGQTLVAIDSGANINFDRLRYISERTEIGEKREAVLAVTIPERPGAYKAFCQALGKRSITEFNYRYADSDQARIFVGVQVSSDPADRDELVRDLREQGYDLVDMTDNELAKLHIRHMVGGHAAGVENEMVFRFEFPERPGALLQFLNQVAGRWNISLFHYRNHGSAFGRVLVGMEVPHKERAQVRKFLTEINYPFWEETDNEAYQYFLS